MVNIDLRTTWSAECHATPTHKYCCCCYRDRHHQHQFETERLRAQLAIATDALFEISARPRSADNAEGAKRALEDLARMSVVR